MSKKKLKNTEAVEQLLKGEHKSQVRKKVSLAKEEYSEEVKQKQKKQERLKELRKKYNFLYKCPNCKKLIKHPNDKKFVKMTGKCMDCKVKEDTSMKLEGTFTDYEFTFMYNNLLSFLRDAEKDVDILKKALSDAEYVNEDGSIEEWELPYSKEEMEQKIENDFENFKNDLLQRYEEYLNNIKNKKTN